MKLSLLHKRKLGFELLNPTLCHLQLMVVRAMAWTRSRLLFAANVQAQVFDAIIRMDSVHMIHAFCARQWPSKIFRHDPSMFKYKSSLPSHRVKHLKIYVRNGIFRYRNISVAAGSFAGWISVRSKCSSLWKGSPARFARASKIGSRDLVPKCSDWDPAWDIAVRTSNFHGRSRMAIVSHRLNLKTINAWVLSCKWNSWACH